jgi:ComF family protein
MLSLPKGRLDSAAALVRRAGMAAADWLLPPVCLGCGARTMDHAGLCHVCWQDLKPITAPRCDVTGQPFPYDPGEGMVSAAALADPPAWDRGRAAVEFNETSRRLVHALKYYDRHEAGRLMARMMTAAGHDLLDAGAVVAPVPLYRWRLWGRRFNQSAILARHIAAATDSRLVVDLVIRTRATAAQVGLDAKARHANVARAFHVDEGRNGDVSGRHVVIVDDVITTGATADAVARALKKAGAAQVDVLCFALVVKPARLHI